MKQWRMAFVGALVAVLGTALVWFVHDARPQKERGRGSAAAITASGECAACHARITPAIVRQFGDSRHANEGVTCLDCHKPRPGADTTKVIYHNGYSITADVTSGSCAACHNDQYQQFTRSRHGAPAWTAVRGTQDFTAEQIEFAADYHPGPMSRGANGLAIQEGPASIANGCLGCHNIGEPRYDGSVGRCTACHAGHEFSITNARLPQTCGGCHMGPDHAQLEIWQESRHGVVFESRRDRQHLDTPPDELTAWDMDAPTCATCHMSGLGDAPVSHDVGERLTYYLFAPISKKRPGALSNRQRMQQICFNCHAKTRIEKFYTQAEGSIPETNAKVAAARALYDSLKAEGRLSPGKFDEPADFIMFDLWHHYGRTAKHGSFMGGAD